MALLVTSNTQLRNALAGLGDNVALVPTMGALHQGHVTLIELARNTVGKNGCVVVSDFINPTQFNDDEDFQKYPKDIKEDFLVATAAGANILWAPSMDDIYPNEDRSLASAGFLGEILEGKDRPGHFDGVVTVVSRLFELVVPKYAIFGQKDLQQILVIKDLINRNKIPTSLVVAPTIREADGLALSSRNSKLNTNQRELAKKIPIALAQGYDAAVAGARVVDIRQQVRDALEHPEIKIHYVELLDDKLETITNNHGWLLVAVTIGNTRLIDNSFIPLGNINC
jgi:pantoate--beta-alanine ligase